MSFLLTLLGTLLFAAGIGYVLESLIYRRRNGTDANPYDRFL